MGLPRLAMMAAMACRSDRRERLALSIAGPRVAPSGTNRGRAQTSNYWDRRFPAISFTRAAQSDVVQAFRPAYTADLKVRITPN